MEFLETPKPFLFFGSMCSIYKDFAPHKVCSSEKIIIPGQQNASFHPTLQLCVCKFVPSKQCSVLTRTGSFWNAFILGPGHEGHFEEQYCLGTAIVDKVALRNRRNALIQLSSFP